MADTFKYEYPQRLDLDNYDVYLEQPLDDTSYIFIDKIPHMLTYGKHFGTLSWRSPNNTQFQLKNGSKILFELKDKKGNIVKTDLSNTLPVNGAAVFYTWIEKDPQLLRGDKYELSDGPCTLNVVYELDNVPEKWKGTYNGRSTFQFEIQKDLPNTSPILFRSASLISSSFSISESIEIDSAYTDTAKPNAAKDYERSILHISTSNLLTEGGKVDSIEVLYNEDLENPQDFKLLTTYPISSSGEFFEVTSSLANGLSPISHIQKLSTPRNIRRNQDVTFKLRFLNSNQEVARKLADNTEIAVSTSLNITGSPMILENEDFVVVSGSGGFMFGEDKNTGFKFYPSSSIDEDGNPKMEVVLDSFVDGVKKEPVFAFNKDQGQSIKFGGDDSKLKESSGSAIVGATEYTIEKSTLGFGSAVSASTLSGSTMSSIIASVDSEIVGVNNATILGSKGIVINNKNHGAINFNFIGASIDSEISGSKISSIIASSNSTVTGYDNPDHAGASGQQVLIGCDTCTISASENILVTGINNHVSHQSYANIIGGSTNTIIARQIADVNSGGEYDKKDLASNIIGSNLCKIDILPRGYTGDDVNSNNNIIGGFLSKMIVTGSHRYNTIIGGFNNVMFVSESRNENSRVIIGGEKNTILGSTLSSILGGSRNGISNAINSSIIACSGSHIPSGVTNSVIIGMTDKSASVSDTVYMQNLDVVSMTVSHLTSSIVSASVLYSSGSNIFGDDTDDDDTHTFYGNITASGNISASGTIQSTGNITSLGTTLTLENESSPKVVIKDTSNNFKLELEQSNTIATIRFDDGATQDMYFDSNANAHHMVLDGGTGFVGIGKSAPGENLEVLGNISSSGTIVGAGITSTGSAGHLIAYGDISGSGNLVVDGQITASGGILTTNLTASRAYFTNQVTASGGVETTNITASGNIQAYGDISASGTIIGAGITSTGSAGHLIAYGDISGSGNLVVDGQITASGGILTTNLTASRAYFTNEITASGGIFVETSITASRAYFTNEITASGGIVVETSITASRAHFTNEITASGGIVTANITASGVYGTDLVLGEDTETKLDFETANEIHFDVDDAELVNMAGNQISGSIISTGSFGSIVIDGADTAVLEVAGNLSASLISGSQLVATGSAGHVIATGNISASGNLVVDGQITASGGILTTNLTASRAYFTNEITASGGIFVETSITASRAYFTNQVTASGGVETTNITASSTGSFGYIQTTGAITASEVRASSYLIQNENALGLIDGNTGTLFVDAAISKLQIGKAGSISQTNIDGAITASNDISASGNFLGNNIGSYTAEFIPLTPHDFNLSSQLRSHTIKSNDSGSSVIHFEATQVYATKMIPIGYSATGWRITTDPPGANGTAASTGNINNSGSTAHSDGDTGGDIDFDGGDAVGDGETYVTVVWNIATSVQKLMGGKIYIEKT